MALLGEFGEEAIGEQFVLKQGVDSWALKNLVSLKLTRPKFRTGTSAGPSISYGTGDNSLDAELVGTTPHIAKLVALTKRSATGALPSNEWSLVATPKNGGTAVTTTFTAEMPDLEITHSSESSLIFLIHLDITDDSVVVTPPAVVPPPAAGQGDVGAQG